MRERRRRTPLRRLPLKNFLSLDFGNNGQSVAATVGEQIELTLGLVGPGHYGDPQISSPAIRLKNTAMYLQPNMPPPPGGATVIYVLEAVSEGEVQIKFPVVDAEDPEKARTYAFSMTIRVGPGAGNHSLRANLRTDQANTEPWKNRWVNLDSALLESFVPSLPILRLSRSNC
jgi:hypothetical protein